MKSIGCEWNHTKSTIWKEKKLVPEEDEEEEWEKVFTYSYTKFNDMYVIFVFVHSIQLFIIDFISLKLSVV